MARAKDRGSHGSPRKLEREARKAQKALDRQRQRDQEQPRPEPAQAGKAG